MSDPTPNLLAAAAFNPALHLPGEYELGRIIREAVDYDPDKERMYLTCSVGALAQRIAALTAQGAAPSQGEPTREPEMWRVLSRMPDGREDRRWYEHTRGEGEGWIGKSNMFDRPFEVTPLYAAVPAGPQTEPLALIAAERRRQVEREGWTPGHDSDEHPKGELARAAAVYALPDGYRDPVRRVELSENGGRDLVWWEPRHWPFDTEFKPTPDDRTRELVKAGALIVAEIERLQRASPPAGDSQPQEGSRP